MGENQKRYWNEVVREVERAGVEEQTRIRVEQRQINRKYVESLDEEVARSREAKEKQSIEKLEERRFIEEQARLQKQKKITEKREKMKRQLESKQMNLQLKGQLRVSKPSPERTPEHPFIKLVDGSDERKAETRKKMMMQNDINLLQTKIKQEELQFMKTSQKREKDQYVKYVDRFYDKKLEDRNIFKRKYLKLNNLERSRLQQSNLNQEPNVDQQYRNFISNQIQENHIRNSRKDELDDMLQKINQNANIPTGSPAYLGRNPINHDRRKQLQYLARGTNRKVEFAYPSQAKIEAYVPAEPRQKVMSYAEELPSLQKYYSNHLHSDKGLGSSKGPNDSSTVVTSSLKGYKVRQVQAGGAKLRMNTEPVEKVGERRRFMTFDIILGKNRQICI